MSAPDKAGAIRALPLKLASRKRGRAPVWLQNGTRFRFECHQISKRPSGRDV